MKYTPIAASMIKPKGNQTELKWFVQAMFISIVIYIYIYIYLKLNIHLDIEHFSLKHLPLFTPFTVSPRPSANSYICV